MKNNTLNSTQTIYLVCGLDHERYEDADFTFCTTIEGAKKQCIANAIAYTYKEEKELISNMVFTSCDTINSDYEKVSGIECWSYDWSNPEPKVNGPEFYINRILKIKVTDKDFISIWCHAYQGVDFSVSCIGTREECETLARQTSMRYFNDCENAKEYSSTNMADGLIISFDDGLECQVWNVLQFRKEMIVGE